MAEGRAFARAFGEACIETYAGILAAARADGRVHDEAAAAAQTAFTGDMPPAAPSAGADGASSETLDDTLLGAARAQLHKTYIVAETGDGITIIDQHAAP